MQASQDWLANRARISPQKTALIFGDWRLSYRRLNELAAEMASRLSAAGVGPDSRVAVLMPNRVEYAVLVFALARLGAVMVPLNCRLTGDEACWQADEGDCGWVVCSQETEAEAVPLFARTARGKRGRQPRQTAPLDPDDSTAAAKDQVKYARRRIYSVDESQHHLILSLDSLPADADAWLERPLVLDRPQAIFFTSGTTGYPKGAVLTFEAHFWSAMSSAYRLGLDRQDCWLACLPLYHVGGVAVLFRSCLYGITVLLQDGFRVEAVDAALDEVSLVSLVPTMLKRLLEARDGRPFPPSLRAVLLGGAAAHPDLLEQAREAGLPVAATYGLTEATSQVATATPEETLRKPGSVGKPLLFTRVQIWDDYGQELPAGQTGQIVLQGPTLMNEYYRRPGATLAALHATEAGTWLRTGDLGYLDEQGDLWVVQRRVDLIVSGGENVYPSEVEVVLREHPQILDACVVGIEDAEWGQRVAAALVAAGEVSEAALLEHCRRSLAGYKLPRSFYFAAELPQTASGKVIRPQVKMFFEKK